MPQARPVRMPPAPEPQEIAVRSWEFGVQTALDSGRIPRPGLITGKNGELGLDGTFRPRPHLEKLFDIALGGQTGRIRGQMFSFSHGNDAFLICAADFGSSLKLVIKGNNQSAWREVAAGGWQPDSGKVYFSLAAQDLVAADGSVSTRTFIIVTSGGRTGYLDLATLADAPRLTIPEALADPVNAPRATLNGLNEVASSEGNKYYYRYAANSEFGETQASPTVEVSVDAVRSKWGDNSVKLAWTAIPGAKSYNVYRSTVQGLETLVAADIAGTSWTDDGVELPFSPRFRPTANSTGATRCRYSEVVDSRVYLFGNPDAPGFLYYGGAGPEKFRFGPSLQTGYEVIGDQVSEEIISCKAFRTNRGEPAILVMTRRKAGPNKRYILQPTERLVNGRPEFYHRISEVGGEGTTSPSAVVSFDDNLYYPTKDGFRTTGNVPGIQDLVPSDEVSQSIRDDAYALNDDLMDNAVGVAFRRKIYYLLPVNHARPDEVWHLDQTFEQGAWMKPWTTPGDWILTHDIHGEKTLMLVRGAEVYRFTRKVRTEKFVVEMETGNIRPEDEHLSWLAMVDSFLVVHNLTGEMAVQLFGRTQLYLRNSLAERDVGELVIQDPIGLNRYQFNEALFNDYAGVFQEFAANPIQFIALNTVEQCQWLNLRVISDSFADYHISAFVGRYIRIPFLQAFDDGQRLIDSPAGSIARRIAQRSFDNTLQDIGMRT